VPPVRNLPPGYTVVYPNRDKPIAKVTKAIVVLIMLISVGLMLIVTLGGWSKLQGLSPINFVWCLLYLIIAFYVWRWNRGLLPIAAAFAVLLLIVALIAGTGTFGSTTSWFDRSHSGFASANSVFGGKGLSPNILGLVTILIAPVQALLIFFAMRAFTQGWNVEVEMPIDEAKRRGSPPIVPPAEPSAA
jgi:signal transduction histidine kinase